MRILFVASLAALALALPARADDTAAELDAASHAYKLEVSPSVSLKVGETGQMRVVVIPNEGDHVSPDAPVSLSAIPPKADDPAQPFGLPKNKLVREDSKATAAQGVEFSFPVVGKAPGKAELKTSLVFYICVAKLCAHQKRELSVPVSVAQ